MIVKLQAFHEMVADVIDALITLQLHNLNWNESPKQRLKRLTKFKRKIENIYTNLRMHMDELQKQVNKED